MKRAWSGGEAAREILHLLGVPSFLRPLRASDNLWEWARVGPLDAARLPTLDRIATVGSSRGGVKPMASEQPQSGGWGPSPAGVERIGVPTPAAISTTEDGGSGFGKVGGSAWTSVSVRDPAVLAGWRDFRVEAWRGVGWDGVDPAHAGTRPGGRSSVRGRTGGRGAAWTDPVRDVERRHCHTLGLC